MNSKFLLSVMFGNTQVLSVLPVWPLFVIWTFLESRKRPSGLYFCLWRRCRASPCSQRGRGVSVWQPLGNGDAVQQGAELAAVENLGWREGRREKDKGAVCTGAVSVPQARHTRHKLLGLLQGLQGSLCCRALPICLRGQWGFSIFVGSLWLLSTACFAGDHLSCCWVPCNGLAVWKAKNLSWKLSFCFFFSLSCARSEAIHLQIQEKNNPSY